MKKQPKLGKTVLLNKDTITKLQEDHLNKLKGGVHAGQFINPTNDLDPQDTFSCIKNSCNKCM
ncbi:class I lanthipeptide [Chryseobacterium sp. SIMBA_028]|uniref:class I lanthipeptide n=1 Tax=Pseudomonadati TaxID=3379134 RepID=UPI00397CB0FF